MSKILFVVTGTVHWTLADGAQHPTGLPGPRGRRPLPGTFKAAGHEIDGRHPRWRRAHRRPAVALGEFNGGREGADRMARRPRPRSPSCSPRSAWTT
ncbi:hypothetical protein [Streptomyces sp. KL116D]|uniref:hypothetical protein n=1 Tax=Streptomyces sp. KL116D TaxID=3045152 RepID=UPI0035568BC0